MAGGLAETAASTTRQTTAVSARPPCQNWPSRNISDFTVKTTILISGICGFAGSTLAGELARR
ncbi:MAG: hypothetical protein LBC18_10655, partial [Opitutaceae bacterium]|nr:hypothetical protein [Opitutaceae bacterium]